MLLQQIPRENEGRVPLAFVVLGSEGLSFHRDAKSRTSGNAELRRIVENKGQSLSSLAKTSPSCSAIGRHVEFGTLLKLNLFTKRHGSGFVGSVEATSGKRKFC